METLIEQQLLRASQLLSSDTVLSDLSKDDILRWGFLIAHHIQRDPLDSLNSLISMNKLGKIHPFSQAEELEIIARLVEDLDAPLHEESKEIEKSERKTLSEFSEYKKAIADRSTSASKRSSSDEKITPPRDLSRLKSEILLVSRFHHNATPAMDQLVQGNKKSELILPVEVSFDQASKEVSETNISTIKTTKNRADEPVPIKAVKTNRSHASIPTTAQTQNRTQQVLKTKTTNTKQVQPVQAKSYSRPTTAATAKINKKEPLPQKRVAPKKEEGTKMPVSSRPQTAPYKSTIDKKPSNVSRVQTSKTASSECKICLEPFGDIPSKIHSMQGCRGKFHSQCFKSYLLACIESSDFPLKCPDVDCKNQITDLNFRSLMTWAQYELYQKRKRIKEAVDNPSRFTFCSTPDCENIFKIPSKDPQPFVKCPLCNKGTCLFCKIKFHNQLTCTEYKAYKPEDFELCQNLRDNKWKKCLKCRFWIEKNEGCNHMTCKCGNQFCYVCGKKWHTCKCQ